MLGSSTTTTTGGPSTSNSSPRYIRKARRLKQHPSRGGVLDSEEERQRASHHRLKLKQFEAATTMSHSWEGLPVVVISSDEEDVASLSVVAQWGSQSTDVNPEHEQKLDAAPLQTSSLILESEKLPPTARKRKLMITPNARRILLSSDRESADEEALIPSEARDSRVLDSNIIDLTLTSPESTGPDSENPSPTKPTGYAKAKRPQSPEAMIPLFLDADSSEEVDSENRDGSANEVDNDSTSNDPFSTSDAILILDEPRSVQKPVRRPTPASASGLRFPAPAWIPLPGTTKMRRAGSADSVGESNSEVALFVKPGPRARTTILNSTQSPTPDTGRLSGKKIPRLTKKELQRQELERRHAYAQSFFHELNASVFSGGIPANTELQWNKRLLTTAGRAHWQRTRDGVNITSIQLAEKILDCDERIRNTLSHEMCHLACWIIDQKPQENHGELFKRWAITVMEKRPEVEVTTRHNYDIKYKYEWKCEICAKVYGRHSKSINPDEQACGVCKTAAGRLVPQFQTSRAPQGTPKPKDSQNAAARSRDSPIAIKVPGAFPSPTPAAKSARIGLGHSPSTDRSDNTDLDIEIMADTLKNTRIDAES